MLPAPYRKECGEEKHQQESLLHRHFAGRRCRLWLDFSHLCQCIALREAGLHGFETRQLRSRQLRKLVNLAVSWPLVALSGETLTGSPGWSTTSCMPHAEERGPLTREQRREEMSERIVETALRVLGGEGYEAVTIQRLASERILRVSLIPGRYLPIHLDRLGILRRVKRNCLRSASYTLPQTGCCSRLLRCRRSHP